MQPLAGDPIASAIARGFADDPLPTNLDSLVIEGRVGEAALIALDLLATGSEGDSLDLELAIRLLRRLGLDQTARQSALALLVQERRG